MKLQLMAAGAAIALIAGIGLAAGGPAPAQAQIPAATATAAAPSPEEAKAFVDKAEADLEKMSEYVNRAAWVRATYITDDTQWLEAKATAEITDKATKYAMEASRYDQTAADPVTRRKLDLLKRAVQMHPDSQRGLWLLGISDFQRGQYRNAAATWRLLQPQLEPGSNVAKAVAEQIAVADARAGGAPAEAASSAAAPAVQGAALQVEVALAPALKDKLAAGDVLFVYARADSGPPMPLAVARLDASQLPASVTLTDAMAMTPSMRLSSVARVFVGARITHSGQPIAQSGDLEGDAGIVDVGRRTPVTISIDKVH